MEHQENRESSGIKARRMALTSTDKPLHSIQTMTASNSTDSDRCLNTAASPSLQRCRRYWQVNTPEH